MMYLMFVNLFQSARSKFFLNAKHIMSRKLESSVFGLRRPRWAQSLFNLFDSGKWKFFMNTTYTMCRKLESGVFVLSMPKWPLTCSNRRDQILLRTRRTWCVESWNKFLRGQENEMSLMFLKVPLQWKNSWSSFNCNRTAFPYEA